MAGVTSFKSSFLTNCLSSCPCLCVDSMSSNTSKIKGNAALYFNKNIGQRGVCFKKLRLLVDLKSPFLDTWIERRLSAKSLSCLNKNGSSRKTQKLHGLIVVGELGGQYEDTFNDVKIEIINYFTFKAVRTVLEQLYEMNPPQYIWFHKFVSNNAPNNGKLFLQTLVKERQELAERVMITRLSLYGKWIKKCDHGEIYKEISEENLKLMRDRLLETIIWPSDDTSPDQT